MSDLVIWGAGGHAKVVAEAAVAQGCKVTALLDDGAHVSGGAPQRYPVWSPSDPRLRNRPVQFVVAIGNNAARAECFARALSFGWEPATITHPSALVSPNASVGSGTVVLARAIVNVDARTGVNCIINTAAVVEHDCRVDDHTHVAPGVILGGGAEVGPLALIGTHACVLPLVRIGARSTIGAGAVVVSAVPDDVTAVGVPARIVRSHAGGGR